MKPSMFCLALSAGLLSNAVWAADADVCHSPASPDPAYALTASMPFKCSRAGTHTLSELAQAGWSIVSVQSETTGIDPAHPTTAWMVVIEKR